MKEKCIIEGCNKDATVWYPLLSGNPRFCSEHHNPKDAEPYGCDLTPKDYFEPDYL